jgi:alcohol dehydrogenase class IV
MDLSKVLRYRFLDADTTHWQSQWRANSLAGQHVRHALWLVPTTAGTGSEVTPWATLWDTEAPVPAKRSWSSVDGFAEAAWIDPGLTLTCPVPLTRDCALDTLAHALESIWNHAANAVTAALAVDAARAVLQALPVVLASPDSLDARVALSRASLLGGLAMSQTKTALAHALSYDVTLREGLAHGEACAIWLPMVWELACGRSPVCDQSLAHIFEVAPLQGAQRLRQWLSGLGVAPRDLRHDETGRATLTFTMQSDRGRNFIGT